MKKDLSIHLIFFVSFFILISLFKKWFSFVFWPFWLGGAMGTFLPDIDHLLYVFMFKPHELTSQRVNFLLGRREFGKMIELLYGTRSEREGLVFHTSGFQLLFLVLTFWMVSSSGSIFGRGLVMAFSLHLLVDQITDLVKTGSLASWNTVSPVDLGDKQKAPLYSLLVGIAVCIFGFLM